MKKLMLGLLVAFLMSTGLVAFSSTQASAACPYTGCFATTTSLQGPVNGPVTTKKRATFKVTVKGRGTNAKPRGTATVRVSGKRSFAQQVTVPASGVATFKLRKLVKGTYRVRVTYSPNGNSPFKGSASGVKTFTIKR